MGISAENRQETAEIVALRALAWLAGHEEAVNGFLNQSGLAPSDLAQAAGRPEMLAAVLDYLLEDEALLLAFCGDTDVAPESPAQARMHLPGGDVPHWT